MFPGQKEELSQRWRLSLTIELHLNRRKHRWFSCSAATCDEVGQSCGSCGLGPDRRSEVGRASARIHFCWTAIYALLASTTLFNKFFDVRALVLETNALQARGAHVGEHL